MPKKNAKATAKEEAAKDGAAATAPGHEEKKKGKAKANKPTRLSALDAAAQVLAARGEPMTAPELIAAMAEQKLWTSPNGKTPAATLYAAILREITTKGKESRFSRPEPGKFARTAQK